jgi:putative heme-binding domain-containing protein
MPVSQKIGPDGCLYVMDWYDRYHCYQDANRDSPGLDRSKGRIYRISYGDVPPFKPYDLQKLSTDELLKLLDSPNVFWRRMAQRVLNEKFDASMVPALEKMALDTSDRNNAHMHALWLLVSQHALSPAFHEQVLASSDPAVRNWGVRACGEMGKVSQGIYDKLKALTADPSPDVRVQVAVAAGRLAEPDPLPVFKAMLDQPTNAKDPLIPVILYNNLKPLAERRGPEILAIAENDEKAKAAFGESTLRWITAWINAGPGRNPAAVVASLKKALAQDPDPNRARQALQTAVDAFTAGGVKPDDRKNYLDKPLRERIAKLAADPASPAHVPALAMSLWWNDAGAIDAARKIVADPKADAPVRVALLKSLAEIKAPGSAQSYLALAADDSAPILLRQTAVEAVADSGDAGAIKSLLTKYPQLPPDLRPMTVNALTHSRTAAEALLDAVTAKQVPASDINANHVRQMASLHNKEVDARIEQAWGKVKTERDPERVKVVERMKKLVTSRPPGNPVAGQQVFTKTCAQCHTIYGQGGNVGPDLTGVGRENLDAVLTNLLDPSLVIGAPYLVYDVRTKGGDMISGILVEKSDKQVVVKDQTKQTAIPMSEVKKITVESISMMPEGLEKTMTEQEFVDLVAFMLTREPPK